MKVPSGAVAELNKRFIDEHAETICATLERSEERRFCKILREMGATDEQIEYEGLAEVLYALYPEKASRQFLYTMPPATHGPFNSPEIRNWYFGAQESRGEFPGSVTHLGYEPFYPHDLNKFLSQYSVASAPAEQAVGVLVLGRENWDDKAVDAIIDLHIGKNLRIYSQEMFLAYLSINSDPFHASTDVLEAFKTGHPGLEFVSSGWRGWVDTFVPAHRRTALSPRLPGFTGVEESPLTLLDYHVGKTGKDIETRREILTNAFKKPLPSVNGVDYMAEWDQPGTPNRLKKIADHIANECRKRKKQKEKFKEAIEDWEDDLAWLKQQFYNGHIRFHWPKTVV